MERRGYEEDVAGAGAKFEAHAKRTKNRIVSSEPLSAVSAAAHGAQSLLKRDRKERFREFGRELPKAWGVLEGVGVMMCGFLSRGRSLCRARGCPHLHPCRRR